MKFLELMLLTHPSGFQARYTYRHCAAEAAQNRDMGEAQGFVNRLMAAFQLTCSHHYSPDPWLVDAHDGPDGGRRCRPTAEPGRSRMSVVAACETASIDSGTLLDTS